MNTALTLKSSNAKTGPIPVSTTSRTSCAPGCPFLGDMGCYADAGYYTRMHWDAVTAGKRGLPELEFIAAVRDLKPGSRFRHNVAGDLWHDAGVIRGDLLRKLADAAKVTHITKGRGLTPVCPAIATANGKTSAAASKLRDWLSSAFGLAISQESSIL